MAGIAGIRLHSGETGQDDGVKGEHGAEDRKNRRSDPSKDGH